MNKKMVSMEDLIDEISMGPFGSDITVDNYVSAGVPVLNGSNISGVKLTEVFSNYVTTEKAASLKKANARRGDIVVTHRGTLGQVAYIPDNSSLERYVISQSQFRVSLNRKLVDPAYFTYYFHTNEGQKRLLSFKSHVGVPALAQATSNFRKLEFPLIPLSSQLKIAKVLSDLDDKIALNNKIHTELEAMAKLIYDYWFVQFDVPNANGKPYKSSGGKMVYNEALKCEIPKGWTCRNVDSECTIRNGYAFKSESYTENGYTIVRTKNFKKGSVELGDMVYISNEDAKSLERYSLCKFDFLLVMVGGSLGNNVIVNSNILPALQNQNMWCFRSRYGVQHFTNQLLKKIVIEQLSTSSGSAREFLKKESFKEAQFANPGIILKELYFEKVSPVYDRIDIVKNENQKLIKLRNWLLPMLMNGQVTVKDLNRQGKKGKLKPGSSIL